MSTAHDTELLSHCTYWITLAQTALVYIIFKYFMMHIHFLTCSLTQDIHHSIHSGHHDHQTNSSPHHYSDLQIWPSCCQGLPMPYFRLLRATCMCLQCPLLQKPELSAFTTVVNALKAGLAEALGLYPVAGVTIITNEKGGLAINGEKGKQQ